MSEPIQVKLYLKNGTLEEYVRGEIAHWTGTVCCFPITALNEYSSDPLLLQSGIYLLLGQNDQGQTTVYVGKSIRRRNGNSFNQRLLEHTRDHLRGKWTRAVCVINQERNGTHISRIFGMYSPEQGRDPRRGGENQSGAKVNAAGTPPFPAESLYAFPPRVFRAAAGSF